MQLLYQMKSWCRLKRGTHGMNRSRAEEEGHCFYPQYWQEPLLLIWQIVQRLRRKKFSAKTELHIKQNHFYFYPTII